MTNDTHFYRKRQIYVTCPQCGKVWNETDVEFIDVEEDMFGQDKLTFRCPGCKLIVKSLRRG